MIDPCVGVPGWASPCGKSRACAVMSSSHALHHVSRWVLALQKLKQEMEALQSSFFSGLLQSYQEEHRDCLSEIVQAIQTAQLHREALAE